MTRRLLRIFAAIGVVAVLSVAAGAFLYLRDGCPDVGVEDYFTEDEL